MALILFADDTNIFISCKCFDSLINRINIDITKIFISFKINKLSLIIKKLTYDICKKWIEK